MVFRDLLIRESGAPRWFELLQIFRRLEARGEIRGGRFVTGVAGEQFAMSGTIQELRKLRDESGSDELTILSAADPLNLVGILTKDARVPSTAHNRLAYWNGNLIAYSKSEELFLVTRVNDKIKRELVLGFGLLPSQDHQQNTVEERFRHLRRVADSQKQQNPRARLTEKSPRTDEKKSPRPSFL